MDACLRRGPERIIACGTIGHRGHQPHAPDFGAADKPTILLMAHDFDRRIARASELAAKHPESRELLRFYGRLAAVQKTAFEDLTSAGRTDLALLLAHFPALLEMVRQHGPEKLAAFAEAHLVSDAQRESLLRTYWNGETRGNLPATEPAAFFARSLLQPYAEYLARRATFDLSAAGSLCPFCGARPVAAILRGEGEGARRSLICCLCATERPYRRVLCPGCNEEDKDKLPVFVAEEWDYIRVEACDTCKTYLKCINLAKNGRAVPMVDELAAASLAIWAEEHGYAKLEPNILGM
jgi:FdhE protein